MDARFPLLKRMIKYGKKILEKIDEKL